MIYVVLCAILSVVAFLTFLTHSFFKDKKEARSFNASKYDELMLKLQDACMKVEALTDRTAKFEARYDAITKTFLAEVKEIVKYEERKVQDTQVKAFQASRR